MIKNIKEIKEEIMENAKRLSFQFHESVGGMLDMGFTDGGMDEIAKSLKDSIDEMVEHKKTKNKEE